ncbi:hypothetical protein CCUN_0654 [Campylobacter cuniculorum DSM 23162 = LMG 24588]|uniref:Uncharacterized protein n=1 Tax=Campylobacter cuniculorum DSM 23162 = LMG 24588 TaxID=1121267 RepID=A0A1W6BW42_9BACT|nr:hypothetical protein CCUN_0654 [Campylobacter cuniculorum DSM 23162 = LMG 24588]
MCGLGCVREKGVDDENKNLRVEIDLFIGIFEKKILMKKSLEVCLQRVCLKKSYLKREKISGVLNIRFKNSPYKIAPIK